MHTPVTSHSCQLVNNGWRFLNCDCIHKGPYNVYIVTFERAVLYENIKKKTYCTKISALSSFRKSNKTFH